MKKTYFALIIIFVLSAIPVIVSAQTSAEVTLGSVDLSLFPKITTIMDVRDINSQYISGLSPEEVVIVEDGQEFPAIEVIEKRIGAQVLVAYNLGTALQVFDNSGASRIDYINDNLISWIDPPKVSTTDSFSLLSTDGILVNPTYDGKEWAATALDYKPVITVLPSWEVLSTALNLVSQSVPKEGMRRVLIFITPLLPAVENNTLQDLADRAKQNGIRLFIGLVDSSKLFDRDEAKQLEDLALQTGGHYFAFSGHEPLPDLNKLIESSRYVYQVSFDSKIVTAGEHEFALGVRGVDGNIWSQMESFDLDLRSPNPFFLSPPSEILRTIADDDEIVASNLFPNEEKIQILIEFPDRIDREIVRSSLYIDDVLVAENNLPPFTEFTIDLRAFESSQLLIMWVEASDEFGLIGSSIETPLSIIVEYPEPSLFKVITKNINLFAIGLGVFAGGMLLLLLILSGQIKPARFGARLRRKDTSQDPNGEIKDDLTAQKKNNFIVKFLQSVYLPYIKKLSWFDPNNATKASAFLIYLATNEGTENKEKFSIGEDEVLIGSGVEEGHLNIDNLAVQSLHARLWQDEQGQFNVVDLDSVAGTWINYSNIGSEVHKINHGEILHIANIGFRFVIANPPELNQAKITSLKEKP